MSELVPLAPGRHKTLKITPDGRIRYASTQHMLHVRVTEVPKTVSTFPVFLSKNAQNGQWTLSAISSFVPGSNLFVKNNTWQALYQPDSISVYPLYLMKAQGEGNQYQPGIVEGSDAFNDKEGEALFTDEGQPTLHLADLTKRLESTLTEDARTYKFTSRLDELGLIKPVDVVLHYSNGQNQVLSGLHTINEDALQQLGSETLDELNRMGYLAPIHAMLISIFQLNRLVLENNARDEFPAVSQVRLEVARDRSLG